jgi:protein-S-isoprenylcysteine O-methyltransferase Ste14
LLLAIASSIFLILTANKEEKENLEFFGEEYQKYMENTTMFIPFVL